MTKGAAEPSTLARALIWPTPTSGDRKRRFAIMIAINAIKLCGKPPDVRPIRYVQPISNWLLLTLAATEIP
jgi:hypothetical protein